MKVTIHPAKSGHVSLDMICVLNGLRTSDGDLHADVHEDEEGKQMHSLELENLAVRAVLTSPGFACGLSNLRQTFYIHRRESLSIVRFETSGWYCERKSRLTVLRFEPKYANEKDRVEEGGADRGQVHVRPMFHVCEMVCYKRRHQSPKS